MKNLHRFLFLVLLISVAISACQKGDDPATGQQCYPKYLSKLNGNDIYHFTYDKEYKITRLQRTISDQRMNTQTTYTFYYNGNNLDSLTFLGLDGLSSGKYHYNGDKRVMSIWYADTTGNGVVETGRVKLYYKDDRIIADTGYERRRNQVIPVFSSAYEYDAKGNLIHFKQNSIEETGNIKFKSWQEFQYNDKINPFYGLKYLPLNMEYWNPNYRTKVILKKENGEVIHEIEDDKKNIRWNDAGYPTNFDYGSFTYECK